MFWAVFLVFVICDRGLVAPDRVDLIELNHYYDSEGKIVFHQVIFWDWSDEKSCLYVRSWRFFKSKRQCPVKDSSQGDYVAVWYDGNVLRRVRARSFLESWTQYDPEVCDRERFPQSNRRELTGK